MEHAANPFWQFAVQRILGEGGMGTVYLMTSLRTGRRFAVKRARQDQTHQDSERQALFRELQTWVDLPEHPHIVGCLFFRSFGDEIAIFLEYVEGGSLDKWINDGQLTDLGLILDIAIQAAWGLHALHEIGVVHQDVKPANFLLTPDCVVKVTDFGISRARAVPVDNGDLSLISAIGAQSNAELGVSFGGMTGAYCSPEQAASGRLTRKTDIWSWGLCVLEMFSGGIFWDKKIGGPAAGLSLESYWRNGGFEPGFPPMPEEVHQVLRRCFAADPEERWETILDAANVLIDIFRKICGREYPRRFPGSFAQAGRLPGIQERRHKTGIEWRDPREWLRFALEADGRDPDEADSLLPAAGRSRESQAVADLAAFEEARRILEGAIARGRIDLRVGLAELLTDKALVHGLVNDHPGETASYEKAISIYEALVGLEGIDGLRGQFASTCVNAANARDALGQVKEAIPLYERAIALYEQLVHGKCRLELLQPLAASYANKAVALSRIGAMEPAQVLLDKAIGIYEELIQHSSRHDLDPLLAMAYAAKASVLDDLGASKPAIDLYDRSIAIYEGLIGPMTTSDLRTQLSSAYLNKAVAFGRVGDAPGQLTMVGKAIALREQLVRDEAMKELRPDLAKAYETKAQAFAHLGRLQEAFDFHKQAIGLLTTLVEVEDRFELRNELADSLHNMAVTLSILGDLPTALSHYGRAIRLYEALVSQGNNWHAFEELARAYMNKAVALQHIGDCNTARLALDKSVALYGALIEREGMERLRGDYGWARALRALSKRNCGDHLGAREEALEAVQILSEEVAATGRPELHSVLNQLQFEMRNN
jgi:serine/threonine protein kinase